MRTLIAIALMPLLAACETDTSYNDNEVETEAEAIALLGDPLTDGLLSDESVVNACESNYYSELTGLYDGQIQYTSDDDMLTCEWEVDLQINGEYLIDPVNRRVCDLTMNMISTSTNPEGCSDVGLSGDMSEPLKAASNSAAWVSPPWPIDVDAQLSFGLSDNTVYPIGKLEAASVVTFSFDGEGNATYPESFEGDWSGVLVKQ